MNKKDNLTALLDFLDRLEAVGIYYTLSIHRPRMIMISIDVPGERWEVEFGEDGDIDVEVFVSLKGVGGPERLDELFERFSD
jgi:hypothetical protein